jgi:predicted small lipoprotein YifL
VRGRFWRAAGFCVALAALAACGIKGDPVPPEPAAPDAAP